MFFNTELPQDSKEKEVTDKMYITGAGRNRCTVQFFVELIHGYYWLLLIGVVCIILLVVIMMCA